MNEDAKAAMDRLRKHQAAVEDWTKSPYWGVHEIGEQPSIDRNALNADCQVLACVFLDEHPADSELEITEEWLLAVGFGEPTINIQSILAGCHSTMSGGDPVELFVEVDGHASIMQSNEGDLIAITGRLFETRGQLRQLCRALGIELKEPSNG